MSSACLNLDLLSSSSDDDSKDSAGLSDLSITLSCDSEEALTLVNSDQVLSDGDFPEESVPKDKRQVIRRCASPPVVDLVMEKCRPGKSFLVFLANVGVGRGGRLVAALSPNRVQAGCSQDVPDEGSLFNVSPLSPGIVFRPSRGDQPPPAEGVLLPTLDDFND